MVLTKGTVLAGLLLWLMSKYMLAYNFLSMNSDNNEVDF